MGFTIIRKLVCYAAAMSGCIRYLDFVLFLYFQCLKLNTCSNIGLLCEAQKGKILL